jgi:hypothetical protein
MVMMIDKYGVFRYAEDDYSLYVLYIHDEEAYSIGLEALKEIKQLCPDHNWIVASEDYLDDICKRVNLLYVNSELVLEEVE